MVSNPSMIGQSRDPAEPGQTDTGVSAPAAPAIPPADATPPSRPPLDPTRYGDWEKNGRCIDF
jgi:hypothetical protein